MEEEKIAYTEIIPEKRKKPKKSFKERWNERDEICPCCNSVVKKKRGLTKQNLKNLFKKPSLQDIIIFIMIVLVLIGAWAYSTETAQCKAIIEDPTELCTYWYKSIQEGNYLNTSSVGFNISGIFDIKEGNAET